MSDTSIYLDDLYRDLRNLESGVVVETGLNMTSIMSSAAIAGLTSYLMKNNEPLYQVGIMGVSQFVAENLNRILRRNNLSTGDPKIKSAVTVLLSTGLYSVINRQSRINVDMMNNGKIGLLSSAGGELLQFGQRKYISDSQETSNKERKKSDDDDDDCTCDLENDLMDV